MKILEQINNHYKAAKIKKELPNIVIRWETDINKMDFSKLRSYRNLENAFSQELLRIDNADISNEPASDGVLRDVSCIEMLDIILNGGKLIPPAYVEQYAIIDGKEQKTSSVSGGFDGHHRIWLARFLGLDTIPVCVFKQYAGHWFTPDKWTFEEGTIKEEAKEYNAVKAISKETGEVFTFREYGANVDISNPDYIIIIAANEDRPF